jgi:predicted peptidase
MNFSKWAATLAMCAVAAVCALSSGQEATTVVVKVTSTPAPASASAPAELSEYEAIIYTDKDGKTLPYRLLKPAKYDPKTKYPLVLFLHGSGERGNDNIAQIRNGTQVLARAEMRSKFPCFEIVPQCPAGRGTWAGGRATSQAAEMTEPLRLAMEIVAKTRKDFSIDDSRLYITGLSMGGFGTWDVITRNPTMFAAAAPVCGGGFPDTIKGVVEAKLPIWVWHGAVDGTVPPRRSQEMVKALKDAGLEVKFTETAGQGHNEWDITYASDEFWTWLFAQKKK